MKIAIFLGYFLLLMPLGIVVARVNSRMRDLFFWIMIFFTCQAVLIHLVPWPEWRGTSRGFGFALNDFAMFIVLGSMLGRAGKKFVFLPWGGGFFWFYFGLSMVSIINAEYGLPFGFEVWKMVVMYLFFITVYNYLLEKKSFWPLIYIIIAILSYMMLTALFQKYIEGRYHINVTLAHRNSMALYCTMFGSLLLGVLLNEKCNAWQLIGLISGFAFASLMVLFSLSRGGLVCYGVGLMVTIFSSLVLNGLTSRRVMILMILGMLGTIVMIKVLPRIIERFLYAPESSKGTRLNLARAATRMADDYFWGVGLNNFTNKSGPDGGYNDEHYEAFAKKPELLATMEGGIVETIYLLVAAECGWITMLALLLWLLAYYLANIRNLFVYKRLPGFGMAAGMLGGLTGNYLQSTLEWVLKQYSNFYQLMLIFAIIALMIHFRPKKQPKSAPAKL